MDAEDDDGFKLRKKKKGKKVGLVDAPIKVLAPSNEAEEEKEDTIIFTKMKRNESVHDPILASKLLPKQKISYDIESLKKDQRKLGVTGKVGGEEEDEEEGPISSFIPSKNQIEEAKRMRETKRLKLGTDSHDEGGQDGFIPVNENAVSTFRTESRLVTEDQDEGEETFDDYAGNALAFGARAVKEAQDNLRREKVDLINGLENDEDDDEQFKEWEMQHIHDGQRTDVAKATKTMKSLFTEDFTLSLKIPEPVALLAETEILSEIETAIENLKVSIQQNQAHIDICKKDSESSETTMVKLNAELESASTRYEYFQGLNSYVSDLIDFLDAKEPVVLSLENAFVDLLMNELVISTNERRRASKDALGHFLASNSIVNSNNGTLDQMMDLKSENDLKQEKVTCFDDASKYFKKLHHVKERLDKWKIEYPKEYEQGYGAMSMAGIFDIYVRLELVDWSPLTKFTPFEEMKWHEELLDFGVEDSAVTNPDDPDSHLLKNIIEKTCIPRFQVLISVFDLHSRTHNDNALQYMRAFQDYSSIKDPPMQNLLDSIEDRISTLIDAEIEMCSWYQPNKTEAHPGQVEWKRLWLSDCLTLLRHLMLWKRYLGNGVVKRLALEKIIEGLVLPGLENCHHLETDLEAYCQVADLVKEFIPDVYQTPAEFKFLEVSFLRYVHVKVEKTPSLQSIPTYAAILRFCSDMKSFQACSAAAKRLQELQSL